MAKPTKHVYSFEFKLALVERFIEGEISPDLAEEAGLSSPRLFETWYGHITARARTRCVRSLKADQEARRPAARGAA